MGLISPYSGDPLNVLVAAPLASPQVLATGARGPKGPQGDPFQINAQGPTSELSLYDNERSGFSFLATDTGLLYLRDGETSGVWTDPIVFGGPPGVKGEPGRGITGAALSAGHLVLSYSDGQEDDLGNVRGPIGPAGLNITSATVNGSGHLILTLSDSSVLDAGLVVGDSGSWGSITGLLSNQADLTEALNNKVTVVAGKGLSTEDYSSVEKNKLAAIAANATANADTDSLAEGATNKYFTEGRVRGTVLTGLSLLTGGVISAADSVLSSLGKLQKQISDAVTAIGSKQDTLVSGTSIKTVGGQSLLGSGDVGSFAGMPYRIVTASGSITPADAGKLLICTNAAAITLTVGAEATSAWTIAGVAPVVHLLSAGAGTVTIAGDTGVTVDKHSSDSRTLDGQHAAAALMWRASNVFSLVGRLAAV